MIIASNKSSQFDVYKNNGSFAFAKVSSQTTTFPINSMKWQSKDLTGDGFADLVIPNNSVTNEINIFKGDGLGGFVNSQKLVLASALSGNLVVEDFNGDRIPDLAGGSSLTIYHGDRNGTFALSQSLAVTSNATSLTAIDLGSNGTKDLVSGNLWRIENTNEAFSVPVRLFLGDGATQQFAADMNADGLQDLVGLAGSGIQVLLQDQQSTFSSSTSLPIPITIGKPVVGDFNGDGALDLAGVGSNGIAFQEIRLLGKGNGEFSTPIITSLMSATDIAVGDFNGDGNDDTIVISPTQTVVSYSSNDGTSNSSVNFTNSYLNFSPLRVVVCELNGDGKSDFATLGSLNNGTSVVDVYVTTNTGFNIQRVTLPRTPGFTLISGDFDGDGDQDLLFEGGDGTPTIDNIQRSILRNDNGILVLGGNFTLDNSVNRPIIAIDSNLDGRADLVSVNDSVFKHYRSFGNGSFELIQTQNDGGFGISGASALYVFDMNGDQFMDVVSINGKYINSGTFSVYLGLRDGTFATRVDFAPPFRPTGGAAIGDFNFDGKVDLVTTPSDAGSESYQLILNGINRNSNTIQALNRTYRYDPAYSSISSAMDELARETRFQIDPANGNVLGIQRPLGYSESMTYTSRGLLDTHRDALGRVTDYDYDLRGRVISIVSAKGTADETTVLFGYDPIGNVTSITDPKGNVTQFGYDSMRRVTSETDALGGITIYTYDKKGNVTSVMDAKSRTTLFDFDALSRLVRSTDPLGHVTRFGYDIGGNQVSVTDPNGNLTRKVYDVANRLIRTIDPDGGVTKFTYDRNDNLLSVTDPNANVTRYFYDERNRVVRELDSLGKSSYFLYDGVNNLIARKDRIARQTHFTYDALDRMTKERWQGTKAGQFVNTITSNYDIGGNLKSIEDNYSKLAFTYDSLDRVKSVSTAGTPNAASVLLSYAYDDNSNRTSVTDVINGVNGATVVSQFDELDRLKQMTQTGASTSTKRVDFAFNAIGQYTSMARSNNVDGSLPVATTSFSYDVSNRLSLMDHKGATGTSFVSFGFGYDSASRITRITEKNQTIDYGYDRRDQLVSANYGDAARVDEAFKFDANGNRVESNAHGTAYRTGSGNRLTTDGVYNYAYDTEGNLTKRTEIASGSTREFQWDHRNRLTMLSDKNSSGVLQQVVRYSYDSLGRRISKQVDTTPLDTVDAAIEQYVYDGEDVILDFVDPDGSGPAAPQQTTRYLRGPGIDNLLAIESVSGTNWVLQDHLGSTRALVSSAGVLVQSIDYDSFGKAIVTGTPSTRYLYTGRELDAESGLFYYRARYYDSSTGRFTNEDPIGFAGGSWNTQIYVDNSPLSWIDPFGTQVSINLFNPNESSGIHGIAQSFPPKGTVTVGGHGNPSTMVDADGRRISPTDLAKMIRDHSDYSPGVPVQLLSCNTGKGNDPYAQKVADELGGPVIAPDDYVWYSNPPIVAPPRNPNNLNAGPHETDRGNWNMFWPK